MSKKNPRDMIGYGSKGKKIQWPNNARIAVQIVLNYEEGAENCVLNGDNNSEVFLSEIKYLELPPELKPSDVISYIVRKIERQ
mgnify:CR=1 FL=1